MGSLERRNQKSVLSKADDVLLVVIVGVVALVAIQVVGWVVGTVWFLVKAAVVVGMVALAVAYIAKR